MNVCKLAGFPRTTTRKLFRSAVAFPILLFGGVANSATVLSNIRYENVANFYTTEYTGGGPLFELNSPWHAWYGSVTVGSDPNEQIYSLALRFVKDLNQQEVLYEVFVPTTPFGGDNVGVTILPGGDVVQNWKVDWSVPWWSNQGVLLSDPRQTSLTGTATLSVTSSLGNYDVASYSYSYFAIIPEPSSLLLGIFGAASCCYWRRRS